MLKLLWIICSVFFQGILCLCELISSVKYLNDGFSGSISRYLKYSFNFIVFSFNLALPSLQIYLLETYCYGSCWRKNIILFRLRANQILYQERHYLIRLFYKRSADLLEKISLTLYHSEGRFILWQFIVLCSLSYTKFS